MRAPPPVGLPLLRSYHLTVQTRLGLCSLGTRKEKIALNTMTRLHRREFGPHHPEARPDARKVKRQPISAPATVPVIAASVPPIMARNATAEMSLIRSGAIAPRPPIWIPMTRWRIRRGIRR